MMKSPANILVSIVFLPLIFLNAVGSNLLVIDFQSSDNLSVERQHHLFLNLQLEDKHNIQGYSLYDSRSVTPKNNKHINISDIYILKIPPQIKLILPNASFLSYAGHVAEVTGSKIRRNMHKETSYLKTPLSVFIITTVLLV